jgi:hypothetical protein
MPEVQQQMDGHQQMAAKIHSVFAQGQGVQVSSAQAEQIVEMKLWLAAIANGQLKIVDLAATGSMPVADPDTPPS